MDSFLRSMVPIFSFCRVGRSCLEHGCPEPYIDAVMAYEAPHDRIAGIDNVQGVICEMEGLK